MSGGGCGRTAGGQTFPYKGRAACGVAQGLGPGRGSGLQATVSVVIYQRHHIMDGDGKRKGIHEAKVLANSSQIESVVSQLWKLGKTVQEAEVLAWLLSVGGW